MEVKRRMDILIWCTLVYHMEIIESRTAQAEGARVGPRRKRRCKRWMRMGGNTGRQAGLRRRARGCGRAGTSRCTSMGSGRNRFLFLAPQGDTPGQFGERRRRPANERPSYWNPPCTGHIRLPPGRAKQYIRKQLSAQRRRNAVACGFRSSLELACRCASCDPLITPVDTPTALLR